MGPGTLDQPITRRTYLVAGVVLAIVKYVVDAALVWNATGEIWSPLDYLSPFSTLTRTANARYVPAWLMPTMAVWALPFIWIGLALTIRRAIDAGRSPWIAFGFFVPFVNYAVMLLLCLMPSRTVMPQAGDRVTPDPSDRILPAMFGSIAAGVVVGVVMVIIAVVFLKSYGAALFLGTPVVMGALAAFLLNRHTAADWLTTVHTTLLMFGIVAAALALTALEGLVCIVMLVPIVLVLGLLGAMIGARLGRGSRRDLPQTLFAILALPLAAALEPSGTTGRALHEVRSSIDIAADPDRVWSSVVSFATIPEPTELVFRLGIAYPQRAQIVGIGVGAVRYCVFSTGAFVEPITAWEPGRRLAFDVSASPPPLRELSPYRGLSPPHLDHYLRSRRGEFRLVPLAGGGTRLEGSTWYELEIAPEGYWQLYADYLIGRIHWRVLEHIKREAEK